MHRKKLLEFAMCVFLLLCLSPPVPCRVPLTLSGGEKVECYELETVVRSGSCVACFLVFVAFYRYYK